MYSGYSPLSDIRNENFFSLSVACFFIFNDVFSRANVFNFDEVQFIILKIVEAFLCGSYTSYLRNSRPPQSQKYFLFHFLLEVL